MSEVRFPNVDPTACGDVAEAIHMRALKLQAQDDVTYAVAVKRVLAANPDLESEYAKWSSNGS